jgi:glycerol-3-phosphate acyltransferase PlsY
MVLLADIGKGIASVYIGRLLSPLTGVSPEIVGGLTGLSSIVGHNWPIFLRFKGGKGVATSAGVFLALTPLPFVFSLMLMLLVVFFTRYVSLGSILSAGSLPLFILLCMRDQMRFYLVLSLIAAGLILFTHRSNLRRLLSGRERKLGEREKI